MSGQQGRELSNDPLGSKFPYHPEASWHLHVLIAYGGGFTALDRAHSPESRERCRRADDIVLAPHGLRAAGPYGAAVRIFARLGADVEFDFLEIPA